MESGNPLHQELLDKLAHFEDIFRAFPDAVVMNTAERRIAYVNRAAVVTFGYTPDQIIGDGPQRLYAHEADFRRMGQLYADLDHTSHLPGEEVLLKRKNGETFPAEINGSVVRGAKGDVLGFLSIIRDLTESKAMEEAIRLKESQLRQIIDLVPHLIFVKDRTGRFLLVNEAHARSYNTTVEEQTGTYIQDYHQTEAEIAQSLADDAEVIDSGQMKVIDEEVYNDIFGVSHILQTTKIPFNVPGEGEPAVLAVAIDQTRQRQAETLLRQANTLLETSRNTLTNIIEQLPIGIQIMNRNGACIDVNQAFVDMFGVEDPKALVETYNIFNDDLAVTFGTADAARRAIAGETVNLGDLTFDFSAHEGKYSRARGKKVINVTLLPIFDQRGEVSNIIRLNSDVTQRTEAEESRLQLAVHEERVKVLEELITTISHDFKTPLTIIGTSLYLFEKIATDDTARKHIKRIEEQLVRLANLIHSLLTMSRLIGITDLSFLAMDLKQLVYNVYSAKRDIADSKSITFTYTATDEDFRILASEELTIAFTNLIDNAIAFTPRGGEVTLTIETTDENAIVEITDSGVGISKEDLHEVFERFFRADKARGTDTGGAGLGLAIVKQIIELHHGEIVVNSRLQQGSTFRVTLPKLPARQSEST